MNYDESFSKTKMLSNLKCIKSKLPKKQDVSNI